MRDLPSNRQHQRLFRDLQDRWNDLFLFQEWQAAFRSTNVALACMSGGKARSTSNKDSPQPTGHSSA